jgi:uncharacterized membrane protein YoaK (UPF0700 family)
MSAQGVATISFGPAPGSSVATVVVTGQTTIGASDAAEAFLMADTTADHNETEHIIFRRLVGLTCGSIVAGTGFTITAESELRLTGDIKCRWVWSE